MAVGSVPDPDRAVVAASLTGMLTMKTRSFIFLSAFTTMLLGMTAGLWAQQPETGPSTQRVIIFVWDGLRTDDLTPEITPNYFALARSGVVFADHHAVYPTFTMMNSASIATGAYPGKMSRFSPLLAASRSDPGVQMGEPCANDWGVQISPRVAETPR